MNGRSLRPVGPLQATSRRLFAAALLGPCELFGCPGSMRAQLVRCVCERRRRVRPPTLLPRNKARLIHYRGDWKALRAGVEDDQFDALNLELIRTVRAV
jgi:hypothetical protein